MFKAVSASPLSGNLISAGNIYPHYARRTHTRDTVTDWQGCQWDFWHKPRSALQKPKIAMKNPSFKK